MGRFISANQAVTAICALNLKHPKKRGEAPSIYLPESCIRPPMRYNVNLTINNYFRRYTNEK
jgi:hypothetical protein